MIAAPALPQSSPAPLVSVVLLYAATLAAAMLADRDWIFFVFLAAVAFASSRCAKGP